MKPINVLYLMEGFELGGAERRFVRMAQAIDRPRFRLTVGTLHEKGPLRDDMQATNTPIVDFTRRSRFDLSPVLSPARVFTSRGHQCSAQHALALGAHGGPGRVYTAARRSGWIHRGYGLRHRARTQASSLG